ncbi:formate dehydrogenase subunit alpha [Thermodesulforhabdus norvegica]|uniref:Formate dehydrogenase major subunit n=1 Tax=Thermodesulforhabdus norvegica TaxID=39841 RepID=A0A1I4TPQ0_9BACT|nr:formate dehydrogenase subunit alpha [Thermodesulforhabdus norvegica]SFM78570.1 formate dehydrogenase major subunit [Thermodesulforhabdus norvegica]
MKRCRVVCPFCGAGCVFELVVQNGEVKGLDYVVDHPVAGGALCAKGNAAWQLLGHPDRITTPLIRNEKGWQSVSWDRALDGILGSIMSLRERYGPESVAFLASAKATNEENYMFQKFARLFGSPHIDHCARLCHAPSVVGLRKVFGSGAMTNPISHLALSDCLLIIGSNLAETHPVVAKRIFQAKDRGALVIVVDPRKTATASIADLHVAPLPGTDLLLLGALMKVIIERGYADYPFIGARTVGFEGLEESLRDLEVEKVSRISGVDLGTIVRVAEAYGKARRGSLVYCMGITQHRRGTDNVLSCANLALLCGHIGRDGTGLYPLRGQNNVQGACDMGCLAEFLPGYVPLSDTERSRRFAELWGCERLPSSPGYTAAELPEAIIRGEVRGLVIMGENPVVTDPASGKTAEALKKLDFLALIDLFPTETSKYAHVILPAAAWAEKSGSYTNTERRVQWSFKAVEPPGEAMPDLWTISELGRRAGFWKDCGSAEEVLDEIAEVIPAYGGITSRRLKNSEEGLIWPCPDEAHEGTPVLFKDRFYTDDGLARFTAVNYSEKFPEGTDLFLITGRLGIHYNSGSITRRIENLNRYKPEAEVEINPGCERAEKAVHGKALVKTSSGEACFPLRSSRNLHEKTVFIPFHFPEVNNLTEDVLDPEARVPAYKDTRCSVEIE